MKPVLTTFFQSYPIEGDLKLALKMIKHKLHHAIEEVEEHPDGDDYMKYLSDAHRMIETIFSEMGAHPSNYR